MDDQFSSSSTDGNEREAGANARTHATVVLRGVVSIRFADGGASLIIAGDSYGRAGGERRLHLSGEEAAGLSVGDRVSLPIEVIRG